MLTVVASASYGGARARACAAECVCVRVHGAWIGNAACVAATSACGVQTQQTVWYVKVRCVGR